jgi:MFS transporter, MHS family, metabolite:H+ symporter
MARLPKSGMMVFGAIVKKPHFAALPFLGIQLGTVLASLVYFILLLGVKDVTQTWLWRVPFLISLFIVAVAIYMRLNLKESPTFAKLEARHQTTEKPLANLLKNSQKTVGLGIGLRLAENGGSSIYQALAVSYVVGVVGVQGSVGSLCLIFAPLLGALIVPLSGILTDRYGRVIVYRGFAIFQLLIAFPVWWVLSLGNLVIGCAASTKHFMASMCTPRRLAFSGWEGSAPPSLVVHDSASIWRFSITTGAETGKSKPD